MVTPRSFLHFSLLWGFGHVYVPSVFLKPPCLSRGPDVWDPGTITSTHRPVLWRVDWLVSLAALSSRCVDTVAVQAPVPSGGSRATWAFSTGEELPIASHRDSAPLASKHP